MWPITISPNGRKWTEANLVGGAFAQRFFVNHCQSARFYEPQTNRSDARRAMLLDLDFENIGVRYLAHLPILENTEVRLKLRGSSMEVTGKGGVINLPSNTGDVSPVQVETVLFFTPNYRDRLQPVDIDFTAAGSAAIFCVPSIYRHCVLCVRLILILNAYWAMCVLMWLCKSCFCAA